MIDNFSLLVSHGLILLACWRLLSRPDLDDEGAEGAARTPFRLRLPGRGERGRDDA